MKKIILCLTFCVLLSSCATMHLRTVVPYNATKPVSKIALFPVMIGELQQPIFPLIDAGMFNAKTNSVSDQIMDMQSYSIANIRGSAAKSLSKMLNCEVLTGDTLFKSKEFTELRNMYHNGVALRTGDEDFPVVLISENDINPFPYSRGNVVNYFKTTNNYKQIAILLCEKLNVDAIAISFSKLNVTGVSGFGISGALRLETYLYVIDSKGDYVLNGYALAKPISISGKNVNQYKAQIDEFPFLFESLVKKIVFNN